MQLGCRAGESTPRPRRLRKSRFCDGACCDGRGQRLGRALSGHHYGRALLALAGGSSVAQSSRQRRLRGRGARPCHRPRLRHAARPTRAALPTVHACHASAPCSPAAEGCACQPPVSAPWLSRRGGTRPRGVVATPPVPAPHGALQHRPPLLACGMSVRPDLLPLKLPLALRKGGNPAQIGGSSPSSRALSRKV